MDVVDLIKTEKSEKKTLKKNGGVRIGAGRKKGGTNQIALVQQMNLETVQSSIRTMARKLITAQAAVALGTVRMAVLTRDSSGKLGYVRVSKEEDMQRLLDEGEHGKDYVIIAGEDPDWKAAADLLNRAGLKPKDTVEHTGGVGVLHIIKSLDNASNNQNS